MTFLVAVESGAHVLTILHMIAFTMRIYFSTVILIVPVSGLLLLHFKGLTCLMVHVRVYSLLVCDGVATPNL